MYSKQIWCVSVQVLISDFKTGRWMVCFHPSLFKVRQCPCVDLKIFQSTGPTLYLLHLHNLQCTQCDLLHCSLFVCEQAKVIVDTLILCTAIYTEIITGILALLLSR